MNSGATGFCNSHNSALEKPAGLDYGLAFQFMSEDDPPACGGRTLSGMGAMFNRQGEEDFDAVYIG